MGVDTVIRLPGDCRVGNVATVVGILLGRPKSWVEQNGARWVNAQGVHLEPAGIETLVRIRIEGTQITQGRDVDLLYHLELGPGAERGMMPRSYSLWIATGKRLVEFFGGSVDYNDCDEIAVDFERPHPGWSNAPEDGEAWADFQQRLWDLAPLTAEEIAAAKPLAAYG